MAGDNTVLAPPAALPAEPEVKLYSSTAPIVTLPAPHSNITVRPFRMSDAEEVARHANNRTIWLRMSNAWPSPYGVEDAKKFIKSTLVEKDLIATGEFDVQKNDGVGEKVPTKWAVCDNDVRQAIGSIGLTFMSDVRMRTALFGYWLGEAYWEKGIMGQLAPIVADLAFEKFGRLMRMDAYVFDGNPGSCRCLEKSRFDYSYFDRKGTWKDGKVVNCHMYGRPRDD